MKVLKLPQNRSKVVIMSVRKEKASNRTANENMRSDWEG
jgi:hypothetical protein